MPARHAACRFKGASIAPGYVVADSTPASAHEAAPWLCAFVLRQSLLIRHRFATVGFMLRIKPLRLAGGYRVAWWRRRSFSVFGPST